jgi:8-oxo-dGTP pyrophosphatase MutT (NUDIX family)
MFRNPDLLPADLIYPNMDYEREDAMKLTVRGPPAGKAIRRAGFLLHPRPSRGLAQAGVPVVSRPTVLAAGGVLWRRDSANPEVALVHRPEYDDWSLPKGKAKPGEHLLVTALREVSEETGYRPRIGPYLTTVRYPITSRGRRATKIAAYWSMRCSGGSFGASREVDEMRWLPLDEAANRLSSAADRVLLAEFGRTRADTEPLLLVRYGATVSGPPRFNGRPGSQRLSRSGRDQAACLVPVLAGLGITELLSADLPACVDMLAPFAATAGMTVRRQAQLTAGGFAGNEHAVADRVRHDASCSQALVVCGGQRVIAGLVGALIHGSDVLPPPDARVKKGGWWLLHHRDGAVSAYERHAPAH